MDDQKNRILVGVIAFNIVVMLYMGYRIAANGSDGLGFGDFFVAFLLASIVGGAAFAVAMMKK
jgi:hypothetical protein